VIRCGPHPQFRPPQTGLKTGFLSYRMQKVLILSQFLRPESRIGGSGQPNGKHFSRFAEA
jgi:hypothetical protein